MTRRPIASVAALAVAGAGLLWALVLVLHGGFDFEVYGRRVTTNEPMRPLAVAALGFVAFTLAHGVDRTYALWTTATAGVSDRWLVGGLTAVTLVAGVAYNSTAASGSDSYGYVSQADLWLNGALHVPQPWAEHVPWPSKAWSFSPLGYRPVEGEGRWEIVPTYSPGLPLLMAGAKYLGGQSAMFLVVPLFGSLMILATWGIGCRLGASRAGLIAAWLVLTSPVFLLLLVVPMSDVAAAGAWTIAVFFILGNGPLSALGAGLAAGTALMIRPNLLSVAVILGLWIILRRAPAGTGLRHRITNLLAFATPVALAGLAIASIYQFVYGSPTVSGYGRFSDQFAWANVLPNVRNYLSWFVNSQTELALAGLVAVFVPLGRWWPGVRDRRVHVMVASLVLAVWLQYFAYLVFENFRYLRFLLLSWPFVMLGVAGVALWVARQGRPALALGAAGVTLALGIHGWRAAAKEGAFDAWQSERRFVSAALLVRDRTPPNSVVLTMLHSGSLRYYGGRMTVRYDMLDADWLDRGVAWLNDRGVRVYALLENWELAPFEARFARERLTARLKAPPLFEYRSNDIVRLYDLSGPVGAGEAGGGPEVFTETFRPRLRAMPPAPAPTLVFAP